jgi:flavin reductase (DIM6/NTAB) family NADH-FMN oxidoreductase RutF/DNA-binding GntR family transcriptional regulator
MTSDPIDDAPVVDSAAFRHVVGHLASGVTVITTTSPEGDFGMTASSVTSLSADPPMMLACLNQGAPTGRAVSMAGTFCINVLGQEHAHLATQFAIPSDDKFKGVNTSTGVTGVPVLDDALAHIECEVVEEVSGGTHSIFIGRVVRAVAHEGAPLTYFRGGFGRFEFVRDDEVYQRARQQVLDRLYAPGDVIALDNLAEELEVETSAAFYALTRMTTDGLVQRDPERGYVIVPFDTRTSDEAFDARCAIELGIIDLALGRVTQAELEALRVRFEAMEVQLVADRFVNFELYLEANLAFHEKLVSFAHNAFLSSAFGRLSLKSVMTRSFGSTPQSSQEFIDVHRQLLEAFETSDAPAARSSVRQYTELAKERVREILKHTGGKL